MLYYIELSIMYNTQETFRFVEFVEWKIEFMHLYSPLVYLTLLIVWQTLHFALHIELVTLYIFILFEFYFRKHLLHNIHIYIHHRSMYFYFIFNSICIQWYYCVYTYIIHILCVLCARILLNMVFCFRFRSFYYLDYCLRQNPFQQTISTL